MIKNGEEAVVAIKQVILLRKDLKMGAGKAAAQAAHASVLSYLTVLKKHPDIIKEWILSGQTKIVLRLKDGIEAESIKKKLSAAKIPFAVVTDAGRTQVAPGTETAIGVGPYYADKLDSITGDLQLF
jgi:PTH2 family peptidyl-tRNA hydrolase